MTQCEDTTLSRSCHWSRWSAAVRAVKMYGARTMTVNYEIENKKLTLKRLFPTDLCQTSKTSVKSLLWPTPVQWNLFHNLLSLVCLQKKMSELSIKFKEFHYPALSKQSELFTRLTFVSVLISGRRLQHSLFSHRYTAQQRVADVEQ